MRERQNFPGRFEIKKAVRSHSWQKKKAVISCKFNEHILQTTLYQILNYANCASFNLQFCLGLHSPVLIWRQIHRNGNQGNSLLWKARSQEMRCPLQGGEGGKQHLASKKEARNHRSTSYLTRGNWCFHTEVPHPSSESCSPGNTEKHTPTAQVLCRAAPGLNCTLLLSVLCTVSQQRTRVLQVLINGCGLGLMQQSLLLVKIHASCSLQQHSQFSLFFLFANKHCWLLTKESSFLLNGVTCNVANIKAVNKQHGKHSFLTASTSKLFLRAIRCYAAPDTGSILQRVTEENQKQRSTIPVWSISYLNTEHINLQKKLHEYFIAGN